METLARNCQEFGIRHFAMGTKDNGIIHVVGPEKGLSLPGMTIVCGDSHTSTHGAVGAIAMGIGTSEVAEVLASQCILQQKPKTMRINVEGTLQPGVTAKDIALYIMAQMTTGGATGYAVEYAGSAIRALSMEGRLTLSNLSIEMGSRAGIIAPDDTTFEYLKGREYAPKGEEWDRAVERWRQLKSDCDAVFDKEVTFRAEDIKPRITYGTNPGAGIAIDECIPSLESIPEQERQQDVTVMVEPTLFFSNFSAQAAASATLPMVVSAMTHSTGEPSPLRRLLLMSSATALANAIVFSSNDSLTPPWRPSMVGRMPIFG